VKLRRLALASALALSLAACEKVTRTVTSQVSPCFKVLPQAHAAVGGQGTFVDVTRIRGSSAQEFPAHAGTTTTVQPSRDVCVVAYEGTFDAGRIEHLIGDNRTGRYALVVVSVRTQRVHAVILIDRLPSPLHKH
jgi:hypothetical protein